MFLEVNSVIVVNFVSKHSKLHAALPPSSVRTLASNTVRHYDNTIDADCHGRPRTLLLAPDCRTALHNERPRLVIEWS